MLGNFSRSLFGIAKLTLEFTSREQDVLLPVINKPVLCQTAAEKDTTPSSSLLRRHDEFLFIFGNVPLDKVVMEADGSGFDPAKTAVNDD